MLSSSSPLTHREDGCPQPGYHLSLGFNFPRSEHSVLLGPVEAVASAELCLPLRSHMVSSGSSPYSVSTETAGLRGPDGGEGAGVRRGFWGRDLAQAGPREDRWERVAAQSCPTLGNPEINQRWTQNQVKQGDWPEETWKKCPTSAQLSLGV